MPAERSYPHRVPTAFSLAVLLLASPGSAAPVAAVEAAVPSFPADYLRSVSLSLASQPFYASRFLNSFQTQLNAVAAFPAAPAAAAYLQTAASAGKASLADVRAAVGRDVLTPESASALLIANSLTRPEQFPTIMDGLEELKPGLGLHAAALLRAASGAGDRRVLAALRAAGERRPDGGGLTYGPDGRWATLFDGSRASRAGAADDAPTVDPNARDAAARSRLPALTKPQ
jgi:hypothetical protein